MKKRTILIIIVLAIATVFLAELMSGNNYSSWFGPQGRYLFSSSEQCGNVSILRRGTGYILKQDVGLADGDKIITSVSSSAKLKTAGGDLDIVLGEYAQISVVNSTQSLTKISADAGNTYIRAYSTENKIELIVSGAALSVGENTRLSAEAYPGTQTVNIYSGEVTLHYGADTRALKAGEKVVFLQNEDGGESVMYGKTDPKLLCGFLIEKLLEEQPAVFDKNLLLSIVEERRAETQAALDAQKAHEEKLIAQGGTVQVVSSKEKGVSNSNSSPNEKVYTCTLQIRCDTIFDNMDKLKEGKAKYVPKDGVILDTVKVEFYKGETVYNALKRACNYFKIPIEYRWYVEYGGYYIEGINNLYEFDCGGKSGWMYKVNGWYPNYGCSNYKLKDKDVIVWYYTCDLGKDL